MIYNGVNNFPSNPFVKPTPSSPPQSFLSWNPFAPSQAQNYQYIQMQPLQPVLNIQQPGTLLVFPSTVAYASPAQQAASPLPVAPQLTPTYIPMQHNITNEQLDTYFGSPSKGPVKSDSKNQQQQQSQPQQPKQEDSANPSLKRCLNCSLYYDGNNLLEQCRYHPGKYNTIYSSVYVSGGSVGRWSCCGKDDKENGCVVGPHKEDPALARVQQMIDQALAASQSQTALKQQQSSFPQIGKLIDIPLSASESTPNDVSVPKSSKKKSKKTSSSPSSIDASSSSTSSSSPTPPSPSPSGGRVILHYIRDCDTLVGLSLKYRVSQATIRQLNRMKISDVQAYSRLFIPKNEKDLPYLIQLNEKQLEKESEEEVKSSEKESEEEKQLKDKRQLQKFRNKTGVSESEAKYYLSVTNSDVASAFREYQEDLEFEKKNPYRPSTISKKVK
eukprot:TRINITY_DN190_c2_g1_i1.p1 TRINITY_DN190_c2_g1~~TRINITY_DN190_c2_g1_i1.p1  ORF type:complete len:443 (+),score=165.40 TRINITY_DN190_c2_g1_i1:1360-2688(+)